MLSTNETRIVKAILNNKNEIKSNHTSLGNYYDFIFLCGGEKYEKDNRSMLVQHINKSKKRSSLYSEDLFSFLKDIDLLTFEEILLEISTAVIIILESWGSACELGAFSYVNSNIDKLLVINDIKHKESQSFINDGPLRKIDKHSGMKKRVFFEKFIDNQPRNTLVISSELSDEIDNIQPKKTFKSAAFSITASKTIEILDISYLMWLIVDIIKIFGTIKKKNTYTLILNIFEVETIILRTSAENTISNQNEVKSIIDFLITVLLKFKLIKEDKDNCTLNLSFLRQNGVKVKEFSSVLFKESFLKTRNAIKMKAEILNKAKKDGYIIWE